MSEMVWTHIEKHELMEWCEEQEFKLFRFIKTGGSLRTLFEQRAGYLHHLSKTTHSTYLKERTRTVPYYLKQGEKKIGFMGPQEIKVRNIPQNLIIHLHRCKFALDCRHEECLYDHTPPSELDGGRRGGGGAGNRMKRTRDSRSRSPLSPHRKPPHHHYTTTSNNRSPTLLETPRMQQLGGGGDGHGSYFLDHTPPPTMDREEEEEESMVKKMEEDSRPTHHQERLHPHHRRLEYEDDVSDGSSASVTVATQDQLLKDIQCLIDQEDVARVIKEADANLARSGSGAKHPQIDIDTRPRSSRSEQRRLYHEFAEFKHDTVKEIMRLNDCIERQNDLVHKLLHIVDTSGGGNAKVVADASSAVRTNLMSSLVFSLIEQQKHQLQQQLHQQQKHQHEPRSLPSPSTAMDLLQRMRDSI